MSDPAPFISDAEYLACESDWLRQRADAIAAQQESKRDRGYGSRYHPTEDTENWKCKIERLVDQSAVARERIDARLAAGSRCGGFKLGLNNLQSDHKLSKFERLVLLVCTLTAIDQRVTCAQECLDGGCWSTPDLMFLVAKKGFADRIKMRSVFGPESALFRDGLLRWSQTVPNSPDLLRERFEVTPWTLDIVIGTTLEKAC